jgi:hypothetical protein
MCLGQRVFIAASEVRDGHRLAVGIGLGDAPVHSLVECDHQGERTTRGPAARC